MRYYCIADEDTVRGFRLAGIAGEAIVAPPQAREAVRRVVSQPDIGVVILTETLADALRREIDTLRLEHDRPLIVEIPGPEGPRPGRQDAGLSFRKAVGMHVDFGEAGP